MDQRQPCRRRRPALSCLECRRRKLKCDRSNPCGRCVSTETQCTYKICQEKPGARHRQTRRMSISSVPSPPTVHPAEPLSHVEPLRDTNRAAAGNGDRANETRAAAALPSQTTAPTLGANEIQNLNRPRFVDPELHDLRGRIQRLERSLVHVPVHDLSQAGRDVLAGESGLPDSHVILNKTRIMRWSHWVGIAKEVQYTVYSLHPCVMCTFSGCSHLFYSSLPSSPAMAQFAAMVISARSRALKRER